MNTAEKRATAGLWSIQGIGPVTLQEIRHKMGSLGELLEKPPAAWAALISFQGDAYQRLMALPSLAAAADAVEAHCQAHHTRILFPGDPAFPERLEHIPGAPAMLFAFGDGAEAPPRRRLAIVGTRHPMPGVLGRVEDIADEAASAGLGIISGAAVGIDQAAHRGALRAQGETWAFMGCALDQIDAAQRNISRAILDQGGTLFSEFPPGFRANLNSFTLRNRLISGSSDAVLVVRAPLKSGALNTAQNAVDQGRPLLVTASDPWDLTAAGSNKLIKDGKAKLHLDLKDLWNALGLTGSLSPQEFAPLDLNDLSPTARVLFDRLGRGGSDFETLQCDLPELTSGQISAALVELEVFGAVLHKGGRRYEKR